MRISLPLIALERQLLSNLAAAQSAAALATLRLTTGKRINRPSDDPAGFIYLQSLEREQNAVQRAIARVDAAASLGAQIELKISSAMQQLDIIREKLLEDAGGTLSQAERQALQLQIDAAIEQLDDIAGSTINGRRLLDGSADYVVSGQNPSQVQNLRILRAPGDTTFSGNVSAAATQGTLTHTAAGGTIAADATFTITGNLGSANIAVSNGQSTTSVRDAINAVSDQTGVEATVSGVLNSTLTFRTIDYGSDATIAINVTSGTFAVTGGNGDGTAQGTDASVTINGQTPHSMQGNHVKFAANGLQFELDLVTGYTGAISTVSISDDRVLRFALGADGDTTTLALGNIHSFALGGPSGRLDQLASGGEYSGLGDNTAQALAIVDEAIDELTVIQGQAAAFNGVTVESSAALLEDLDATLASALEAANGVNFAQETSHLARQQLLASNALAALAVLQQQQASTLYLLQRLAEQS